MQFSCSSVQRLLFSKFKSKDQLCLLSSLPSTSLSMSMSYSLSTPPAIHAYLLKYCTSSSFHFLVGLPSFFSLPHYIKQNTISHPTLCYWLHIPIYRITFAFQKQNYLLAMQLPPNLLLYVVRQNAPIFHIRSIIRERIFFSEDVGFVISSLPNVHALVLYVQTGLLVVFYVCKFSFRDECMAVDTLENVLSTRVVRLVSTGARFSPVLILTDIKESRKISFSDV